MVILHFGNLFKIKNFISKIKNLAKKIAQQEINLRNATTTEEKSRIEKEIVRLSACVKTIEDMVALDEAIQDILLKNS